MAAHDPPQRSLVALPRWVADVLQQQAALVLDDRGRLVAINPAVEELLGLDLGPRLGQGADFDTLPPRGREKAQRWLGCVLSGQAATMGIRAVDVTHQLPTGELRTVLVEYHPMFAEEGDLRLHLMVYHESDGPHTLEAIAEPTVRKYAGLLEAALGRLALQDPERHPAASDAELERGLAALSSREQEVLEHLLDGGSAKEIAAELRLSVHTVKSHTRSIFEKMSVHSRAELLARFVQADPVGVSAQD